MRAVMLEVPQHLLDERRRLGHDRWDEMWDGVLHMVPPPSGRHQRLNAELVGAILPRAKARGLVVLVDAGLFRPAAADRDWRIPDLIVARPEQYVPERGVDGPAELVIEIRSPGDESYEKLGFYADIGCREVLVIDPARSTVERFVLREGVLQPASPGPDGSVEVEAVDGRMVGGAGGVLRLMWPDGSDEIPLD